MSNVIGSYNNGNYNVILLDDGTKIRCNNAEWLIPDSVESCDVKITNRCNHNCPYCHENSTIAGKKCNPEKWIKLFDSMHPFTEIALGGGNPLDDLELFRKILEMLKERSLVASVTVQYNDFVNHCDELNELICDELLYGVGISMPLDEWHFYLLDRIQETKNAVLHCIYGLTTPKVLQEGKGRNLRLLFLGYKTFRRGRMYIAEHEDQIRETMGQTDILLPTMMNENWYRSISFDNLAVKQTDIERYVAKSAWERLYMGDDGNTSVYIDLVDEEFSISSANHLRYKLLPEYTIKDVYEISNGFRQGIVKTIDAGFYSKETEENSDQRSES